MYRRKSWFLTVTILVMSLLLAACSTTKPEVDKVDADLSTDPAVVKVNESVRLSTNVTGLKTFDDVEVYFEVKSPDKRKREIVRVDQSDQGKFSGPAKFKETGAYDVYVHVINPDIHETIKKTVEVGN
jgi:hypothetical protein